MTDGLAGRGTGEGAKPPGAATACGEKAGESPDPLERTGGATAGVACAGLAGALAAGTGGIDGRAPGTGG